MPTRTSFLQAADLFTQAAGQVGGLAAAVQGQDVSSALRGGTLGRAVADSLAQCSSLASGCVNELSNAALLCRHRATVIANYELELRVYDQHTARYQAQRRRWSARAMQWANDAGADPGPPPRPPIKPVAPPAWADVRRP